MQELKRVSVRLTDDAPILSDEKVNSPKAAIRLLGGILKQSDREVIAVINLKNDGTPINCSFVSQGAINTTLAEPVQIIKTAILSNAAGIIMMHNHPSGSINPSTEDTYITKRMEEVCNIMGINFIDHIIVGNENELYFSFNEKDMLPFKSLSMDRLVNELSDVTTRKKSLTGLVKKYFLPPSGKDGTEKGYKMLECLTEELDRVLGTDIRKNLREKAREEGLISSDMEMVRKQFLSQMKGR